MERTHLKTPNHIRIIKNIQFFIQIRLYPQNIHVIPKSILLTFAPTYTNNIEATICTDYHKIKTPTHQLFKLTVL